LSLRLLDLRELSSWFRVVAVAVGFVSMRVVRAFAMTVSVTVSMTVHLVVQLVLEMDSMVVVAGLLIVDLLQVFDFKLSNRKVLFSGSSL